jgi:CheY-like chemotaxis protein
MLIDWQMEPLDGIETLRRLRQLLDGKAPPSIMVTAFDVTQAWQLARAALYDAVLVKPVTASALHDCLAGVLKQQTLSAVPASSAAGESETLLRREFAGRRVLLAEDNLVNQEVAHALLSAVGLVIETAEDGSRAVEMALARHHDLILMDMQMPVMDGLAATRAIRARAGDRTPIIAMTANAFGEERAACMAAGMNDHLAKPVDPELLYTTLLRWLRQRDLPSAAEAPASSPVPAARAAPSSLPLQDRLSAVPDYELASGLRNVGGQLPALARVLRRFVDTYRLGQPALLDAGAADALQRWRDVCHPLRGACGAIGATVLATQLQAFERLLTGATGTQGLATQALRLHQDLQQLAGRLDAALTGLP